MKRVLWLLLALGALNATDASSPSAASSSQAQTIADFTARAKPVFDRTRLPPALQSVPLRHLSSGALLRLDRGGDLVAPPPQWASHAAKQSYTDAKAATKATLDLRVGNNIQLGADPAALPANMRAQAEPHIIRSLQNADLLLGTFQEGRYAAGGGAVDCGYSVSKNGGLNWSRSLIPGLTMASGGPYFRATDPVAGLSLDRRMYLNTIAAVDANFVRGAVVVNRSTNNGASFTGPVVVYASPNNNVFPDKNWLAVNTFPGTATTGRVLVTFTLFAANTPNGAQIFRSYSDDGGVSWSGLGPVNPNGSNSQGSQPVYLPGNKMACVYWNFGSGSGADESVDVVLSSNGGNTFGTPIKIANVIEYSDPKIRNGTFLPSATTDRTTGNLYVVYQATNAGAPRIMFTKSTNGGTTWSAPIPISDNPGNSGVFNPAIAASPDGQTLTVAFYDHRANPGQPTLVDLYGAQSFDGGATWQPNIRLTSVSTNAALAPLTSEGYMLGDYLGVASGAMPNVPAVPIWVDTRTGNPDPFVTRLGLSPTANFTAWQAARLSLAQINNPNSGGESGDADKDGEDNISEFRSRTDPNSAASVVHTAQELNLSTRLRVGAGDDVLIGGFIIKGGGTKKLILRALGPSLAQSGINDPLEDPTLELRNSAGRVIASNNNWKDTQQATIAATGIPPSDDRESAIVANLAAGAYTAIVRGASNTTGVGLVELYDLDSTTAAKLNNISTRGLVQTGQNVLIAGLITGAGLNSDGSGTVKILVRGLGPSLAQAGVSGALQDTTLDLHDSNGNLIFGNDNWKDTQQAAIQATGIPPMDDREAAILSVLPKGRYTVVLQGKGNTSGVALVEVYNVP